ncbi:hypothetical protein Tco_0792324 [Tanacetum coccineum]
MWDTAYWGFLGTQIRRIFLDGYGVLDVRIALSRYFHLLSHLFRSAGHKVRIFHPFSKDILSFHDSSPELLCFPIFMSFAMILYMFDFMTYSIARAIYTHDHDLHDLPPSHGGAYGCILMVNTRTDAELAAAVQAAVDAMLPQIREQVREEYRTGAVTSGSNPPPVTIHTWLERFNKQKPRSFEKAVAPVDAENWISHMEKIFDVMD